MSEEVGKRAGKIWGKAWRGGWTAERRQQFLVLLAQAGNVSAAARAVGYAHPAEAYKLRHSDPEFAAAWDRAMAEAVARIESTLVARAVAEIEAHNAALEKGASGASGECFTFDQIMRLLAYYRAAQAKPMRKNGPRRHYATREETDAELMQKLDFLEARVRARHKREAAERRRRGRRRRRLPGRLPRRRKADGTAGAEGPPARPAGLAAGARADDGAAWLVRGGI